MKFTLAAIAAVSAASSVVGQVALPSSIFGLPFSTQCQGAVLQVLTNGSFAQCFPAQTLLPLLTSNSSIIPILDNFMSNLCYSQPCSHATLMAAAQTITTGCAADLAAGKLPNGTVSAAFSVYPTLREVLCTKTRDPYTANSYGGALGPAPIPIAGSTYNSTNGTFCVTSVLTQLSAYTDANLTIPYIVGAASGQNATALELFKTINPNVLCNTCIFGAVNIIEAQYPIVGQTPLATAAGFLNVSLPLPANATLNSIMNSTCAYIPLAVSNNGTLPANITVSIVNSTFPFHRA